MTDPALDLKTAIFAKTPLGQQEIQSRSLGLSALVRRTLVLVDGKRTGHDLSAFVLGHDVGAMLSELLNHGCIHARAGAAPPSIKKEAPSPLKKAEPTGASGLPAPETRSAKDLEMARNFMTKTVNNMLGQHTRLTLIEAIFKCATSEELRAVYPAWVETMSGSSMGLKRLPEFREKLFTVL